MRTVRHHKQLDVHQPSWSAQTASSNSVAKPVLPSTASPQLMQVYPSRRGGSLRACSGKRSSSTGLTARSSQRLHRWRAESGLSASSTSAGAPVTRQESPGCAWGQVVGSQRLRGECVDPIWPRCGGSGGRSTCHGHPGYCGAIRCAQTQVLGVIDRFVEQAGDAGGGRSRGGFPERTTTSALRTDIRRSSTSSATAKLTAAPYRPTRCRWPFDPAELPAGFSHAGGAPPAQQHRPGLPALLD